MEMQLVCESCAKNFSVPYRSNKVGKIRFCSLKCAGAAIASKVEQKECKGCKTPFTVRASRPREFCCNACYQMYRKRNKPVHRCEVCSKEFETTSTRKDSAKFCSRKCMSMNESWKQAISEKTKGEKNWRWTGGKSKETLSAYSKQAYRRLFVEYMFSQVPNHPFLTTRNGRTTLAKHVHIHHIDKDATNNSIENLLAITIDAHARLHHSGRKPDPWECWPIDPAIW